MTTHYNWFGEITAETTTMGSTAYTLRYDYDANGNRTEITYPDDQVFIFEYDDLNRPSSIRHNAKELLSYGYDKRS